MVLCVAKRMSDLHEALSQIREIRTRIESSQAFRGYRAVPTAISGLFAALAALAQHAWIDATDLRSYVWLWIGCALASIALAGIAMGVHCTRSASPLTRARSLLAIAKLGAPLAVGAIITWIIVRTAPEAGWALPGLWQLLFALGLFASASLLPRAILGVALFYLATGAFVLALGPRALAPSCMGIPFAVGQIAAAMILALSRETRSRERAHA